MIDQEVSGGPQLGKSCLSELRKAILLIAAVFPNAIQSTQGGAMIDEAMYQGYRQTATRPEL